MVLLVVLGAVVVFSAGWVLGRAMSPKPEPILVRASEPDAPHYRDVLDRQQTGVVVTDRAGAVEFRNSAAQELAGTHVGVLVDGAVEQHLDTARNGARSEETLDLFGPPRLVVHVISVPLDDGRAVAFMTDITERRRIDQVRTDFVANVSHELRTPIGALMVLAETLVDTDDPDDVQRIVTRMQGEAERASNTIDDLLELSRIESAIEVERERVRLVDVVREAVGRVAELAASTDISISTCDPGDVDVSRSDDVVVDGDRRELGSAVGNLVENAVKYSDPGAAVRVRVRAIGDQGEIEVVDDGVGIPRQDLDRVFERFYRVDRARRRSTGGTGLGLSIVRHVAQRHGGSVTVESVEGEGTTFVLRLPLATHHTGPGTRADDHGVSVA